MPDLVTKYITLYKYKDFLVTKDGVIYLVHLNKTHLAYYDIKNYGNLEIKEPFTPKIINEYVKHILVDNKTKKNNFKFIFYVNNKQEISRIELVSL